MLLVVVSKLWLFGDVLLIPPSLKGLSDLMQIGGTRLLGYKRTARFIMLQLDACWEEATDSLDCSCLIAAFICDETYCSEKKRSISSVLSEPLVSYDSKASLTNTRLSSTQWCVPRRYGVNPSNVFGCSWKQALYKRVLSHVIL